MPFRSSGQTSTGQVSDVGLRRCDARDVGPVHISHQLDGLEEAGRCLHRLQIGDEFGLGPNHSESRESPGRHEDAGLEGSHRVVVRGDARRQASLQSLHVRAHGPQSLVELGPQFLDLARVLGQ